MKRIFCLMLIGWISIGIIHGMENKAINFPSLSHKELLLECKMPFDSHYLKGSYISYLYHLYGVTNKGDFIVLYEENNNKYFPYCAIQITGKDTGDIYKVNCKGKLLCKKNNKQCAQDWEKRVKNSQRNDH